MSSSVYMRDTNGMQNLVVFNENVSIDEMRFQLEAEVNNNEMVLEDILVATTRSDWFYKELTELAEDILEWSRD